MKTRYLAVAALLVTTGFAAPAFAQDAPVRAGAKTKSGTISGTSGAVSSSYARCAPGNPIGGIIVKGGQPGKRTAESEANCPPTASAPEEHRTYTGGRRNDTAAAAPEAQTMTAPANAMPSRLSMTPTTSRTTGQPPAPAGKGISEKGVSASQPR